MTATRRKFLGTSLGIAAGAVAFPVGIAAASGKKKDARIASVGVAGKGWSDLLECGKDATVVAFCDVEQGKPRRRGGVAAAAEKFPKARFYSDWRTMLEKEAKNLDGITVSTPDHMHAPVTMTALKKGLGTYTQKPLTRTIHEARQLTLAASEAGAATQMGNQGHNGSGYRTVVSWVRAGVIGKVKEAHTWSNRPKWPQGVDRPPKSDPVPKSLDWDLWLGVAPERPYVKDAYHAFNWRGWYDFGAGALGDMGCHIIDPVVWSLELGPAASVTCEVSDTHDETFPKWEIVRYVFSGTKHTTGDLIEVTWYDGAKLPPSNLALLPKGEQLPANGSLFIGEKGVLLTRHGGMPELFTEDGRVKVDEEIIPPRDHYVQWTQALRGEAKTTSDFDYAGPLTETVLLGTIACRFPGQQLSWDSERLKFTNHKEANDLVKQEYRKGWEVEGL